MNICLECDHALYAIIQGLEILSLWQRLDFFDQIIKISASVQFNDNIEAY